MHHAKNYANKISPLEKCRRARERLRASQLGQSVYPVINLPHDMKIAVVGATILSAFRPWGVSGPTSKIVAACPSLDGLA
jgi:hypothetical protein